MLALLKCRNGIEPVFRRSERVILKRIDPTQEISWKLGKKRFSLDLSSAFGDVIVHIQIGSWKLFASDRINRAIWWPLMKLFCLLEDRYQQRELAQYLDVCPDCNDVVGQCHCDEVQP